MSKWLEICGHVELENEGFSFSKVLPALNFRRQKCLQEGIEFQNRRSEVKAGSLLRREARQLGA